MAASALKTLTPAALAGLNRRTLAAKEEEIVRLKATVAQQKTTIEMLYGQIHRSRLVPPQRASAVGSQISCQTAMKCGDARCLTSCDLTFVSYSCHFLTTRPGRSESPLARVPDASGPMHGCT